jgi:60 kDa SS-A/Ro ribonucleoprotein
MANKSLFKRLFGKLPSMTDSHNHHGTPAYSLSPKQMLAQYAATGCLSSTFYATAQEQLDQVLLLC